MTDLVHLLPLWKELRETGTEYVLATVVAVDGSGYRKPGARMIVAADGRRVGTISGGCLEGDVARKAFWHTENGPTVRRYSTAAEDGEVPFGMGCGGIIHLLLERSATADPLLQQLARKFAERQPMAVATVLDGDWIGQRAYCPAEYSSTTATTAIAGKLSELAQQALDSQHSYSQAIYAEDQQIATVRSEWIAPRPGLFVFGAGDDAIPLVRQAHQLGWYIAVADGRAHLATRTRFPEADDVFTLSPEDFPFQPRPTDAAVIMTHGLQQDTRILGQLLNRQLTYLGVLGPRRRTNEILLALANDLALPVTEIDKRVESWMERLHAPVGLDLGGDTPADIALAVIAEIQQSRHRASGISLCQKQRQTLQSHSTQYDLLKS
jgi:xanthine/CO dehydrogenase XdhC/CoxF family maturation factor